MAPLTCPFAQRRQLFPGLLLQLLEDVDEAFHSNGTSMREPGFTPALGRSALTPLYDFAIRLLTCEQSWREALVGQVDLRDGEAILDVGCGTGTLAIMLKRLKPGARIVGVDPDRVVLATAAKKARRAGVEIEWCHGFARDAAAFGSFDKVVSALVFHQVPPDEKLAGLRAMFAALRPGGSLHVADYCRQPDWLMRQLFRIIQAVDGRLNTQANVEGAVESILHRLSGAPALPRTIVRTPTGAISLFRVRKGGAQ